MLLRLAMVYAIARFGYNDAKVCILIHRLLSAPTHKSLIFTPVLMTRIIRALLRRHCRISVAGTQTCVQASSLLSACNTLHTHFQ